jgi:hypothetical protein
MASTILIVINLRVRVLKQLQRQVLAANSAKSQEDVLELEVLNKGVNCIDSCATTE